VSGTYKQPLRALIYNRVSADPSGRKVSVESQDVENHTFCERQGWDIVGTITDNDRSATRYATKEREGYQQVLTALDGALYGRVDVLVTWESSRGERRLDGYVRLRDRLERNGVLLAYKGRVYNLAEGDDRFATGLDALLDEREAERARERILRSHRDSVRRGTPRGVTPYGYQRVYDPHSGRMLEQVRCPETAPVVEEMVRRILADDSLYRIAQDLNLRGVPTPRGQRDLIAGREVDRPGWSSSMIRNLLAKQSLMGIRTHNGVTVGPGSWEPIVKPADWMAVQAVLANPQRGRNPSGVAPRHLLSGIAVCGVCGAWLRPLTNRGRPTYACFGVTPTSPKGHVARARPPLDAMVVVRVVRRLEDPNLLVGFSRARQRERQIVDTAAQEIADLDAQIAEYVRSASTRKGMAATAFERVIDDLTEQRAAAEARLVRGTELPPAVVGVAGPDASERWAAIQGDIVKQRLIVRSLVQVVVHRSNAPRGSRQFDESSVEIVDR
jgi:site-specific DNA recombinase